MNRSSERLAAVAQAAGLDMDPADIDNMSVLLARLAQNLTWPAWDSSRLAVDDPRLRGGQKTDPGAVVEATEVALSRAGLASAGGAYTYIDEAGARATARAIDGGRIRGPLAGMPVAVKDLVAVAGRPLGAASAVRESAPHSPGDAPIVAALRRSGAIIIGTTVLHEFAFGVTGINDYAGTPPNPHDPTRAPGGSSSGSAVAVAEGSARLAIGTDTGGSIRIPAALCGVVGFKPAFDAYPIKGIFPLSPTLDHAGFLAGSVGDICLAHALFCSPVNGVHRPTRVGLVRQELELCEDAVRTRFEIVIRRLGDIGCELIELDSLWPKSEDVFTVSTAIMFAEAAAIHKQNMIQNPDRYGQDVRHRLLQGLAIPAADYVAALRRRQDIKKQALAALAKVDCLIGPTVGMVAPKFEQARDSAVSGQLVAFTRLGNVTGLPAISLPIPAGRLPVGLQILSPKNNRTLKLAAFFEGLLLR